MLCVLCGSVALNYLVSGRKLINLEISSHCEERSDEAIPCLFERLLRQKTPRNDFWFTNKLVFAQALFRFN